MEDQVMKSDELEEAINWLHNDVDKAVDDANDVVAKRLGTKKSSTA